MKFYETCMNIVKEIVALGDDHIQILEGERNEKIDAILDKFKESIP